jgi:hypothetical protein
MMIMSLRDGGFPSKQSPHSQGDCFAKCARNDMQTARLVETQEERRIVTDSYGNCRAGKLRASNSIPCLVPVNEHFSQSVTYFSFTFIEF